MCKEGEGHRTARAAPVVGWLDRVFEFIKFPLIEEVDTPGFIGN